MSQRVYCNDNIGSGRIIIESVGTPTNDGLADIWYVSVQVNNVVLFSGIKWTFEVKELIAQLEEMKWKKETSGDEAKKDSPSQQ